MSHPTRSLNLVLPIRTSKRKLEAKSPQQQIDLATSWSQAYGHRIGRVLDSGRSESGKTMDRSTINEAMDLVRSGEYDGIVFALTDRLGRAPIEESMKWIRELNLIGYLALADAGGEPVNLQDPNAETSLVLQLQIARQYWLATARRFRQSQRDAIKAGTWIGMAPLGYTRKGKRLAEDTTYGPVITQAYEIAAALGVHAAVDYLQREVPHRRWDTTEVRRLLSNRAYLGINEFHLASDPVNFPEPEILVSPVRHAALTSQEIWDDAQSKSRGRRSNGEYLLGNGITSCANCGAPLVGALQTVREKTYRRMRCSATCKGGVGSISADTLEAHVRHEVATLFSEAEFVISISPDGAAEAQAELKTAELRLDEAMRQASRAADGSRRRQQLADAEVDRADAAYEEAASKVREIAAAAKRHSRVPSEQEILEDDEALLIAIRIGVLAIPVTGGRGSIEERVDIVTMVDDLDDRAGMLAA